MRAGADGWRLDVADELPDAFIARLRKRLKGLRPDAILIGEVWEDASNKSSYGNRRRYFTGGELDSVMNYPFRTAILNFLRERDDGHALAQTVMTIAENYPPQVLSCNMNMLGTHDTARILTALVDDFDGSREEKARRYLSRRQRDLAQARFLMASFLQYMLPGAPSLYYADEAGMEGYKDPFNRRTFPWGREDRELLSHHRQLGRLRKQYAALRLGDMEFFQAADQKIGFTRTYEGCKLRIYVNRSSDVWDVPAGKVLYGRTLQAVAPTWLSIGPMGFCVTEDL
jgi:glycosidase